MGSSISLHLHLRHGQTTVARVATRRMTRSTVVGQTVRTDNDRFMFRLAQGNLLRANTVFSHCYKADLSSDSLCSLAHWSAMHFFLVNRLHVQTVATVTNATGCVQVTPHCTHACAHFSCTPHFAQFTPKHLQWLMVFDRFFVCLSKVHTICAPCHPWVFQSYLRSLLSWLRLRPHRHHWLESE